jgi:hypothetical protein
MRKAERDTWRRCGFVLDTAVSMFYTASVCVIQAL